MKGLPRTEQRCTCEHLGHHHAGTIHAGACEVRGCTCIRFTWTDHAIHGDVALESFREAVGHMDALELLVVGRAIEERRKAMRDARSQAQATAAWQSIERCKPGTKLHVHARGIVVGTLLRGDIVRVDSIDRERERLYVTVVQRRGKRVRPTKSGRTEGQIMFRPGDVARYELKRDRVDNPPTKADYDSAARIESSLNRMLSDVIRPLPVPASATSRVHLVDAEGHAVCRVSPGAVRTTTTNPREASCIHCRARIFHGLTATTETKEPTT